MKMFLSAVTFLLFIPCQAFEVTDVEVVKGNESKTTSIVLKGNGFGEKKPPVLYDKVSVAYENGRANEYFSSFKSGQQITKSEMTSTDGSIWQSASGDISIQRGGKYNRYPGNLAQYHGGDAKSNLHNPEVWSREGTATEEDQLYLSWWFRQKNDTRFYFQRGLTEVEEKFTAKEGDTFTVVAGDYPPVRGRVVSWDPRSSLLHAIFWGQNNDKKFHDQKIALDKNGATARISNKVESQGSNKYVRVWESFGGGTTFRLSWTNTQVTLSGILSKWPRSEVTEAQWNFMELYIDRQRRMVSTYVNGMLDSENFYDRDLRDPGHSPTIGLIGFDASVDLLQEFWMDDIYMDTSFKRIVLGNADTYSKVSHEEVQMFSEWTDSRINVDIDFGALDRTSPSYIYIYSGYGVVNEKGIPFQSPPVMTQ